MFVTVFYGILNTVNGEVEYVNAGHNPPYVISASGIRKVEMTGGIILGIIEDFDFQSGKLRLNPGERLFLYTDGVTEAFNSKEELFGEERLENFLYQRLNSPIEKIVKESFTEVNNFSSGVPQSDDVTILSFVYNGPEK